MQKRVPAPSNLENRLPPSGAHRRNLIRGGGDGDPKAAGHRPAVPENHAS